MKKGILIVETVLCVLIMGLMSYAALSIYSEGISVRESGDALAWIYTPEQVTAWVPFVLPLVLIVLAIAVFAWAKDIRDERADQPVFDLKNLRNLTMSRKNPTDEIMKEEKKQTVISIAGWIGFFGLLVPVVLYYTRPTNFPQSDLEGMFRAMALNCTPWIVMAILVLAVSFILKDRSLKKEIESAKEAPASDAPKKIRSPWVNARTAMIVRAIVLVLAIVFIVLGIFNGGARDVLVKAVNICTECVGLG